MAPLGLQTVFLGKKVFSQNKIEQYGLIAHELGHIFDVHDRGLFNYRSNEFITEFQTEFCSCGWLGCLSPTQTIYPPMINIFGNEYSDNYILDNNNNTTKYGKQDQ